MCIRDRVEPPPQCGDRGADGPGGVADVETRCPARGGNCRPPDQIDGTSQALGDGEIPVGHARLIARAASEGPFDQTFLVEAAKQQGYDQFAKTMRRHQQEMSDDDGQSIHDRQRNNRTARAFTSRDTGMFVLSSEFDPTTGAQIDTVLAAKERELWNAEDPNSRRTPQQRMADALAELILEPEKGKAKGTALIVVALSLIHISEPTRPY